MSYIRTNVPKKVQHLLIHTKTIKEMLDIIKNTHSQKKNLYTLNTELADTVWKKQPAEEYLC